MKNKVYGKVIDGKIVEFPVTAEIILARGHRLHEYSPVNYLPVPGYDYRMQRLVTTMSVENGTIDVQSVAQDLTFAEILASLKNEDGSVKSIGELSEEIVVKIKTKIANYVEQHIEALCVSRGYDSINNLLGRYSNSANPTFAAEAKFIQDTIDHAWEKLISHYLAIEAGTASLPTSEEEIKAIAGLPASW